MEELATGMVDPAAVFLRENCRDDIGKLVDSGLESLYIEFGDLYRHNAELAEDYLEHPAAGNRAFELALSDVDVPFPFEPADVNIRVTDEGGMLERRSVADLREEDLGKFVAVEGQMTKVTGMSYRIIEAAFECKRCGTLTFIPQTRSRFQEPHECSGCERKGPWTLNARQSDLADQRKIKLSEPPGERAQTQGESLTVFAEDDLCHLGGDHGLADRAGEQVVIMGRLIDSSDQLTGQKAPEVHAYLVGESVVFTEPTLAELTVDETKDEFMALAAGERGDPIDLFKRSIAPRLERTADIDRVLEAAVAWLFNAYRIEQRGEQIRGDLHMAIIGDPGTAKSTIMAALAKIAPKCVFRSGSGGVSKAGLTAAAVQEEFAGRTEWTLEPGILPRANGGHAIIDEIDEILGEKTKATHDALEGEQMVKVDKAGISADLPTRCAVLIGGNPKQGRFDPFEPVAEQLDMDPAFISRMDILLAVTDDPDAGHDREIARTVLEAEAELTEAQVAELMGEQSPEVERTDRPVSVEVMRDWVHHARQHCFPQTTPESRELIEELYLDVRNLNDAYDADDEKPIPATPRVIESAIRASKAFARVELSDTVEPHHVDRTRELLRDSLKLNFDRETGMFDADLTSEAMPRSQRDRIHGVKDIVADLDGPSEDTLIEAVAEEFDWSVARAEKEIEKLLHQGDLYRPPDGGIRPVGN